MLAVLSVIAIFFALPAQEQGEEAADAPLRLQAKQLMHQEVFLTYLAITIIMLGQIAVGTFQVAILTNVTGVAPGSVYRVSDLELASRLSFFLWSSIPDDELLKTASAGKLSNDAIFDREVRRMLADPKSKAFVENFAGQWLHLRNLPNVQPNSDDFPDFD